MKFFIKIYLKLINNFWRIVSLKLIKNILFSLFFLIGDVKNNSLLCYINEHESVILIASGLAFMSVMCIYAFGNIILSNCKTINLLNDEIDDFISAEDTDLTLTDTDSTLTNASINQFQQTKNKCCEIIVGSSILILISVLICGISVVCIVAEYADYKEFKEQKAKEKLANQLLEISKVLL